MSSGPPQRSRSVRSAHSSASTATITEATARQQQQEEPRTPVRPQHTHSHSHHHPHHHTHHHTHTRSHSHPNSRSTSSRGRPRPQQAVYVPSGSNLAPQVLTRGVVERVMLGGDSPGWDRSMDSIDSRDLDYGSSDISYVNDDDGEVLDDDSAAKFFGPDHDHADRDANDDHPKAHQGDVGAAPRTASADDWDNVRDGSISRRAAWRRPTPNWVLPFVIGVTISMGMTAAPRAELYLDLACLAHPPQNTGSVIPDVLETVSAFTSPVHTSHISIPANPSLDLDTGRVLTPGEKWFMDAQRDMFGITPVPDNGKHGSDLPDVPIPLPNGTQPTTPGDGKSTPGDDRTPPPFPEIDPALCKTDKKVAAAAAKLTMTLTMTAGILAAMTTGHWAGVSDRLGRRPIMAIVEVGYLINDACFLLIATYPRVIMHGGIYVLLVGPTLEGMLGGISTYAATVHAYISDVTPDGSRVTAFTRLMAFMMMGFAMGPILGSTLISATGNILSPFYVSVGVHTVFSLLIRFLLPESLSSESRAMLAKRAAAAAKRRREREEAEIAAEREYDDAAGESGWSLASVTATPRRGGRRAVGASRRFARRGIVFLRPLSIFKPRKRADGTWDANLFFLGIAAFHMSLLMGVLQLKANYAFFALQWGWAELGPFMSFMGWCRFFVLVGLMPIIIYYIKPYFTERVIVEHQSNDPDASPWRATRDASPRAERVPTERTPLLSTPGPSRRARSLSPSPSRSRSRSSSCSSRSASPAPEANKPKRSAALDLAVIRTCLLIEGIGYLVLGLNTARSTAVFIGCSAFLTLGAASGPGLNSLALAFLPHQREAGRLFGGIAVVQALASSMIAPVLFSNLFAWAVTSPSGWVEAIFILAAVIVFLAFVAFLFVRLPRNTQDEERGRSVSSRRVGRGRRSRERE